MENFQEQFVKTRQEINRHLTERALEDSSFREALLKDPKGTLAAEFGITIPATDEIVVVEETAQRQYIVLPPTEAVSGYAAELDEAELEAVAGGKHVEITWSIACWGDGPGGGGGDDLSVGL